MPADRTYVGSIDQGTSSTRFIVFDANGSVVSVHQQEFPQILRHPGWCEHDPKVILATVENCVAEVVKDMTTRGLDVSAIKAVGVTNQRETTVVWDAATGEPVANAIVWLDTRTKETVEKLIQKTETKTANELQNKCGLPITTYFSAVKLRWLLDNLDGVKKARDDGKLMFGTIDSWLIYVGIWTRLRKLTGGANGGVHVTDVTNASRTMLMNLHTLQWDPELVGFFGVEKVILPEIRSSAEVYGSFAAGPLIGVPIAGCLGDQQAALVGQRCIRPGEVKNTYGTGCFMLFNTGDKPIVSSSGLLTTVAYRLGKDQPAAYALEGSIAIAGAAVKWLRDGLGLIKDASEVGQLASEVSDTGGVYFVPAFSGLYAPYWRSDARGCIVGLTQYATKHHICRATLEAVCWQSKEIMDVMNKEAGTPLKLLKVDGGLTNSDLCMQLQSDIVGIPVERPVMRETTALGAAIAAGLGVGVWPSISDFKPAESHTTFTPSIQAKERDDRYQMWKKAVERSFDWA
ncbi:Glycerol kinase [Phlyctochytrium bullatum]|nr:Glycerol kinase [Phlyctochytrium bullatum]